jgi:hypothetical protein
MAAVRANNMTNRTTLLVIVAALSLLGSLPGTLQAQQPTPAQQQQIEEAVRALQQSKPPIPPTDYPRYPPLPPPYSQARPPAWLQFVKDNEPWAGLLVAAAVALAITIILGVVIGVCSIVGELIRVLCSCWNRDSGDGPRAPPSGGGT